MTDLVGQLLRYGATGAAGTVANVGLMALLVEHGGLAPAVAAVLSTGVLLLGSYGLLNRWVFPGGRPDSARAHARRGVAFYAVILGGKAVNYALFVGLLAVGVWYPAAWVIGSGLVFLGTFTANRRLWTHSTT